MITNPSVRDTVVSLPSAPKTQPGPHHERGIAGPARHTEPLFLLTLDEPVMKRFLLDLVKQRNNGIGPLLSKCERRPWLAANTLRSSPDRVDPPTSQELFMLSAEMENDASVTKDRVQHANPVVIAFISGAFEACTRGA